MNSDNCDSKNLKNKLNYNRTNRHVLTTNTIYIPLPEGRETEALEHVD